MSDPKSKQHRKAIPPGPNPLTMRSPEASDEIAESSAISNGLAVRAHAESGESAVAPDLSVPRDFYSAPALDDLVIEALTVWLEQVRQAQGGETLKLTPELRAAIIDVASIGSIDHKSEIDKVLNAPPEEPTRLARALANVLDPVDTALLDRITRAARRSAKPPVRDDSVSGKIKRTLADVLKPKPPQPPGPVEQITENAPPTPSGGVTQKEGFILRQLRRSVPSEFVKDIPVNLASAPKLFAKEPARRPRLEAPPVDAGAIARGLPPEYFESEIPGEGPRSGIDLDNLITLIATALLAHTRDGGAEPLVVDLGSNLPPTPPTFERGLQLIVKALKQALQLPALPPVGFRYRFVQEPLGRRPNKPH